MVAFVRMSQKWFAVVHENCDTIEQVYDIDGENLEVHVSQGSPVAFAEDIETFADTMGIDVSEIVVVDPDSDHE